MDIYGPFALTRNTIATMLTRVQPGVGLLCDQEGNVCLITKSNFDLAEVMLQWVGRFPKFYFCYTKNGAQAERVQMWLAARLNMLGNPQTVVGDECPIVASKVIPRDHWPHNAEA
ncbi:MAG TPA: hypothetical protein GXX29_14555 [Firmicutes bacterium]|nr:hypothetical protein [Bacillota bacterium]